MSSAFYPLGMNSYNNRLHQGGYQTWKGRGVYSNPVGITSGNIRPLTNNDPANDAVYKFGLPRPLKQYRRGISIPVPVPLQQIYLLTHLPAKRLRCELCQIYLASSHEIWVS